MLYFWMGQVAITISFFWGKYLELATVERSWKDWAQSSVLFRKCFSPKYDQLVQTHVVKEQEGVGSSSARTPIGRVSTPGWGSAPPSHQRIRPSPTRRPLVRVPLLLLVVQTRFSGGQMRACVRVCVRACECLYGSNVKSVLMTLFEISTQYDETYTLWSHSFQMTYRLCR